MMRRSTFFGLPRQPTEPCTPTGLPAALPACCPIPTPVKVNSKIRPRVGGNTVGKQAFGIRGGARCGREEIILCRLTPANGKGSARWGSFHLINNARCHVADGRAPQAKAAPKLF